MVSEATGVLKSLIAIPSLSRDEEKAADYLPLYSSAASDVYKRQII